MIIQFKIFETINQSYPANGDYVICKNNTTWRPWGEKELEDFIENSIGKVMETGKVFGKFSCRIKYDYYDTRKLQKKYPKSFPINHNSLWIDNKNIQWWSTNIEDLEPILQGNKFGI